MKQISWPQAILTLGLALILMAGVVVLALNDKDVGAILGAVAAVAVVVMSGLGFNLKHTLDQVKDISNGRMTDLLEDNKRLNERVTALAMNIVPPPLDEQ